MTPDESNSYLVNYEMFDYSAENITLVEGNTKDTILDSFNAWIIRHGHDRMVVRFTTTYAISVYHH
jgi:hypothetical protein